MKKALTLVFSHVAVFAAGFLSYSVLRKGNDTRAQAEATRHIGFVTLGQSRQFISETKQAVLTDQKESALMKMDILMKVIDQTMEAFGKISPLNPAEQDFLKAVKLPPLAEERSGGNTEVVDEDQRRRVVLPP